MSTEAAVAEVNREFKTEQACGVVPVFFIRGDELARVSNRHGTFALVTVAVVAVLTPNGPLPVSPPLAQVAALKIGDPLTNA